MPQPTRVLKVFCESDVQAQLAERYPVVERYRSFILLYVARREIAALARQYPVEDITEQYRIRIRDRVVDNRRPTTLRGGKLRVRSTRPSAKRLPPGPHHFIVQFIGPIKSTWLRDLRRLGIEPRTSYGNFAYIVRATERELAQAVDEPYVRWTAHLSHRDRVAIEDELRLPRTKYLPGAYRVQFYTPADLRRGAAALRRLRVRVLGREPRTALLTIEIAGTRSAVATKIDRVAAVGGVRSIRRWALPRPSNDVAVGLMAAKRAYTVMDLDGAGEIVAVCDSGLDTGDPATIHPDFAGRIEAIKSYPIAPEFKSMIRNPGGDDGAADRNDGHGTHVAGSVLGSGAASEDPEVAPRPIRGPAPAARLVFQAVEQEMDWRSVQYESYYGRWVLAGLPSDLKPLFQWAYTRGARIHSNSWGGGDPGAYDAGCEQLDAFVWDHPDFCVLVAVGNDGTDHDGDGKINLRSVTAPATAKNCIAVGASENRRPQFNHETYSGWWSSDYPVKPFRNEPMADDPARVVAFSSRGPTRDGRIKPDVVAPGTFILSTRSRLLPSNEKGWDFYAGSRDYFFMGGTSMATPLAAGAMALLRQHVRRHAGFERPSAALLRATLVAGARKLRYESPASALYDMGQGFGIVDVDAIVAPRAPAVVFWLDEKGGVRTGETDGVDIDVRSSSVPLRVVLAYSDWPGPVLVNNLNLIVIDPQGRTYVGNGSGPGSLQADTTNNVEVVHVKSPRPGPWRVRVVGSNVPQGPQPYAICLRGAVDAP